MEKPHGAVHGASSSVGRSSHRCMDCMVGMVGMDRTFEDEATATATARHYEIQQAIEQLRGMLEGMRLTAANTRRAVASLHSTLAITGHAVAGTRERLDTLQQTVALQGRCINALLGVCRELVVDTRAREREQDAADAMVSIGLDAADAVRERSRSRSRSR